MNCPQCGLYLPDANVERCPRCGWTRPANAGAATPAPGYNPWGNPGAGTTSPPTELPGQYSPSQGMTPPGWSGYPATQQSASEQSSPYGPPAQPSVPLYGQQYGQPAQPSVPMYGQQQYGQYGQYAPPSVPMYGQAAPPSMGQQPAWGSPFPPQPPRKSRTGLIVAVVVVLVLILGAGGGFLALRAAQQGTPPATNGGNPTATVSATATTGSNIVFQDSFNDPTSGWANDSHCSYGSGGYHIKDGFICYAPAGDTTNATVTTTVKQISGAVLDPYGVSVRISDQGHYEFDIDSNGKWVVFKCGSSNCSRLKDYTASSAIHSGLNATNTLSVAMQGTNFTFSINGTQVGQFTDSAYSSGQVGLGGSDGIEVVYSSFKIASA